ALAAHPRGELYRRADGEADLFPLAAGGELAPRAAWRMWRLLGRLRPAVVHAHDAHGLAVAAAACALTGAERPLLVASRRVDFHVRRNPLSRWKYGRVDRFLCASDAIRRMLIEDGVAAEKTVVVHEGVDVDRIAGLPSLDPHRELGLPAGAPVVGNIAALVPHKGQPDLLDAAARVVAQVPEARFVIVGAGELEGALVKQIARLGLERHVVLTGFRTDALSLLKGFDVFVMSSVTEGLGTSVLDAMACGRAVVATRAGGIPESVVDGETGLLVPVRDPAALASAVVRLLRDASLRGALGRAGRTRARARFSAARMVAETAAAYEALAGGGSRSRGRR
ncbi:MAG: glycosyltransferase, partial [Acidobacteria bacterium]|nr:glycosyltransferase [Acidobacteriota bacterium]